MKRGPHSFVLSLLLLATCPVLPRLHAASPPAGEKSTESHFADPASLLPRDEAWLKRWEAKLAAFERQMGFKIRVHLQAEAPPENEDKVPGAYMRALAKKYGTTETGVVVALFAAETDWRVWIGDRSTPRFVGEAGTAEEFTANGKIHKIKDAMLDAAQAKGDALWREAQAKQPVSAAEDRARKVRFELEALLEALIARFGAS